MLNRAIAWVRRHNYQQCLLYQTYRWFYTSRCHCQKNTHLYTQCRRTDDLKHADLTSGLRVYTHTVFQHCEPCLTSCCQTHTVMSVKPLRIHVSFHMVASPTIIVGIYHIKKNMKLVLICFCFLLFFSTGTVLVTTELVLNNTVEILHIFVW